MSPAPAVARHRAAPAALLAAAVVATGVVTVLGVLLRSDPETVGAWWPTVGLACVTLLLAPRRLLVVVVPALLGVVALAGVLGGRPLVEAAALAAVDVVMAGLVAAVCRRGSGRLERLGDLGPLLVAVAGAAVAGGLGVALVMSYAADAPVGATFTMAGLSHAVGLLVLVPPALLDWREPWSSPRPTRVVPLGLVVALVLVLAFSELTTGLSGLTLLVVPLPLLVVAATRHDARTVVALLAWCAAVVSTTVLVGPGTFGQGRVDDAAATTTTQVAQVYLVALALLVLPLVLALRERDERLRLQERLSHEQARSQAVMDTAASLIVITDDDGRVLTVNPETTRLTGWPAEELVGRPLWEVVVAPRDRQRVEDAVTHVLPIPRSGEVRLLTRDGAERTVRFTHAVDPGAGDRPATFVFSGTDVTEARESAETVEHLLRSVTSLGFVGTDLDGVVTLFSAGAERLFGRRSDEAIGDRFAPMLAEAAEIGSTADAGGPGEVTWTRMVGPGGAEGSPRTQDWLALPPGRAPVRISMTCNPVGSSSGSRQGYLFVARDVTDTRRNQEIMVSALRREREVVTRLQELDRVKDDFVSTVSHELRTPMSSIIGSAELLADGLAGELLEAQAQLVEVVLRNGGRLLGLADDLLALATVDRDAASPSGRPLDLREVACESLRAVRPHTDDGRLRWEVDLPEAAVTVVGESAHLERAVTNLLTNAVKFTPDEGTITLAVSATAEGRGTVMVRDTGRGIPASDLEHVFDRFYRAPEVQHHAIQGTGLGLAIVKQVVERHEGRVTVDSCHGEGTTVTIALPLAGGRQV